MQRVRTPLWPHQVEDLEHLKEQRAVLIGWDMGAGKTLAAIERDLYLRSVAQVEKTLVIGPLNTHDSWQAAYEKETDLKIISIDPKNRHAFIMSQADVFIMHPEALRLMPELQQMGFDHVIADECHKFKNHKAAQTRALKKIKVPYKTAMSGSPVTDRPQDFWSILNWLYPRTYTSYWRFFDKAVVYEIVYPQGFRKVVGVSQWWQTEGLDEIRPFYVRRLKEDVMPDLPAKTDSRIMVDLDPKQRRAYNQMRDEMIAWIGEHQDEPLVAPVIISRLQRLQMLALAYLEFDDETGRVRMVDPSPKLDAALEIIQDNDDLSFLVFSQFKAPLQMLGRRLSNAGITFGSFTGDDSRDARADAKARFTGGNARVFLSTIRAGGVGVDGLQKVCSTAIFLDRDWSPMINQQAEDRLHRGGQVHSVHIIDIMAKNTVDLGRMQRLEQKWDWVKRMLGDK